MLLHILLVVKVECLIMLSQLCHNNVRVIVDACMTSTCTYRYNNSMYILLFCLFQGEELLIACSAGKKSDVSALLQKGADVHFLGKVNMSLRL